MPKILVLYHYLYPDDVVSARHFDGFCEGLAVRGWQVEAMPCNRGCRDESKTYSKAEVWHNIKINRVWRPRFRQASSWGRILNAVWMIIVWSLAAFRKKKPDVLVVGTDPVLSVFVAWVWKKVCPKVRTAVWCYDLYPEAAIAEGILGENSQFVKIVKRVLKSAYNACDIVADLGPCMRKILDSYGHRARRVTLVPWALFEPDDVLNGEPGTRRSLFGDATLGLLYSGNFGRAHSYADILQLASMLRKESIHFSFGVRGNCADEVYAAVSKRDTNISIAEFAPESELLKRLGSAEIHLASLRPDWTGVVVPSKFFGSLAVGRPVLFAGSKDSGISKWIEEYKIGWVLDHDSITDVATELKQIAQSKEKLRSLQERCHAVYRARFSKQVTVNQWDIELRALISRRQDDVG